MVRQCHAELVPEEQGQHCGADPALAQGAWAWVQLVQDQDTAQPGRGPSPAPSSSPPYSTGAATASLVRKLSELPALHRATSLIYEP